MFSKDVVVEISNYLTDKEKIYLTMTSKIMSDYKSKMRYEELVRLSSIKDLSYFDNFTNVKIDDDTIKYPKYAKFIHFLTEGIDIPTNVTHLTFDDFFNQPIKDVIPSSVTHLSIGHRFNQ